MTTSKDIAEAVMALRLLNRQMALKVSGYVGATLEEITLDSLTRLEDLRKRMTESNRSDFLGGEI